MKLRSTLGKKESGNFRKRHQFLTYDSLKSWLLERNFWCLWKVFVTREQFFVYLVTRSKKIYRRSKNIYRGNLLCTSVEKHLPHAPQTCWPLMSLFEREMKIRSTLGKKESGNFRKRHQFRKCRRKLERKRICWLYRKVNQIQFDYAKYSC